ncbi:competence type IV pilus minor pilin ComGF [uncultured Holdemanella sp.]|uniref:competence type IV pilus minor pilin ComGF n=1 Tax=uncultured Holdemanella sp. TaxID=1763549 RepID=UPI0028045682|nr:competence type IV pilus minor pilin ComGF [uncultured Holdemanella sp.]
MKKSKRNGFTLIEALLALFITSLVSLLSCIMIECALNFAHMDIDTQNQFAILQLRRELAQSNQVKVSENCLEYILNHEKRMLYFDKQRIVKSPGYEIYMEQIEDAYFYKKDNGYYVWFKKKNKVYTFELY